MFISNALFTFSYSLFSFTVYYYHISLTWTRRYEWRKLSEIKALKNKAKDQSNIYSYVYHLIQNINYLKLVRVEEFCNFNMLFGLNIVIKMGVNNLDISWAWDMTSSSCIFLESTYVKWIKKNEKSICWKCFLVRYERFVIV